MRNLLLSAAQLTESVWRTKGICGYSGDNKEARIEK